MGALKTAGGRGGCPLLLRLDGVLRWVAGMLAMGFGRLERVSGRCGVGLELGRNSGLEVSQVFVVEILVGGER